MLGFSLVFLFPKFSLIRFQEKHILLCKEAVAYSSLEWRVMSHAPSGFLLQLYNYQGFRQISPLADHLDSFRLACIFLKSRYTIFYLCMCRNWGTACSVLSLPSPGLSEEPHNTLLHYIKKVEM